MKKDNKQALYESIMTSVAKEVKKALNEGENTVSKSNSNIKELHNQYKILLKAVQAFIDYNTPTALNIASKLKTS